MMIIDPYRGGVTGPATIEFVGVYTTTFSGAGNEIRTATAVDFGAVASSRAIIAVVNFGRVEPQANLLSVTIDGIAATVNITSPTTAANIGNAVANCAVASVFLPSGTSGDIVATFNVSAGTTIAVYRATNIGSLTPKHTASGTGDGSVSVNINEVADGIVVAAGSTAFNTIDPYTYTHVTKRYEDQSQFSGGEAETPSAVTGQTITMTSAAVVTGSPNLGLIAASFR